MRRLCCLKMAQPAIMFDLSEEPSSQAAARANYRKVTAADAAVSGKEPGTEDSNASSRMCQGKLRRTLECFKSYVHTYPHVPHFLQFQQEAH